MALQKENELMPVAACKDGGESQCRSEGRKAVSWQTPTVFKRSCRLHLPYPANRKTFPRIDEKSGPAFNGSST